MKDFPSLLLHALISSGQHHAVDHALQYSLSKALYARYLFYGEDLAFLEEIVQLK